MNYRFLAAISTALAACSFARGQEDVLRGPSVPREERKTLVSWTMTGQFERVEGRPEAAAVQLLDLDEAARREAARMIDERNQAVGMLLVDRIEAVREITDATLGGERARAQGLLRELWAEFEPDAPRSPLREELVEVLSEAQCAEFDRLLDAWFGNIARVLVPGRGFYIWGGYANCANYPPFLKKHGLYFSQALIWDKQHPVLTRKDFMGAHEWCFYGWKEGAAHEFFGPNNATDLWHVKKVNPQSMVHLTEKPVELAVRAMQFSSRTGENVLDLFGGSGSTLIAAQQTGRRAFLMELDPLYCDVIVQRYEQFTGEKAERVSVGNPTA